MGNAEYMGIILDKKYALPYRVVDAVVFHFLGFRSEKRQLPVLWHQAMLTFCQRYKQDVSSEQKTALLEICKIHHHHTITEEVRRELMLNDSFQSCRQKEGFKNICQDERLQPIFRAKYGVYDSTASRRRRIPIATTA